MLTIEQVQALRIGSFVYHTIEKAKDGSPAPYRVMGWAPHYTLPSGVAAPVLLDVEEGKALTLTS